MEELSFRCSITKSATPGIWVGRCLALDICTQGTSLERAKQALVDAIILSLDLPGDLGPEPWAIPLTLIAEKSLAPSAIADHA